MNPKKLHFLVMILFLAILIALDFWSQALLETLVSKDVPYPPIWFEVVRYLLLSLLVCFFVGYSFVFSPGNKAVSIGYLAVGSFLFLLLTKNVYYFAHTAFLFSPNLNQLYVDLVTQDLNMARIGASTVVALGLIFLFKPRVSRKVS